MLKKIKVGNHIIKIDYDEGCPLHPREDFDNLGKMICFHKRYNLGDGHNYENKDEFLFSLLEEVIEDTEEAEDKLREIEEKNHRNFFKSYSDFAKAIDNEILEFIASKNNIILPLYLIDHSGLSINTTGFACSWDSGQVGWIYALEKDIIETYGLISDKTLQMAKDSLVSEVELYDYSLRGDVYWYEIVRLVKATDEDGDFHEIEKEVDSCGGFFGYDFIENGMYESIVEHIPKEFHEQLKQLIIHG